MRIAVISDTHRDKQMIKKACTHTKDVNLLIHLGDNVDDVKEIKKYYSGKIINVMGNCDFMCDAPMEVVENIGEKVFLITHGHRYGVKYDLNKLRYRAMEVKADVALFGHTHESLLINEYGILFINPGSASLSRKGPNSLAFIDIEGEEINALIKNI